MEQARRRVDVILAQPRGFCAGVQRAIQILECVVEKYGDCGREVYALHEIVHNEYVVESFKKRNVKFVNALSEVPERAVLVFSAHGVSLQVRAAAQQKDLIVIDATCPLVSKVHMEIKRYERSEYEIILIGHKGHREVEGTMGQVMTDSVLLVQNVQDANNVVVDDPKRVAYVTQTTLSIDDTRAIVDILKSRFPDIVGPDLKDICYATQNRQRAVKKLASEVDLVLVVGSKNSSNSNRLLELAKALGTPSYLVGSSSDINPEWFHNVKKIGVTAGASAPEVLVSSILEFLSSHMTLDVSVMDGVVENLEFKLPKLPEVDATGSSWVTAN